MYHFVYYINDANYEVLDLYFSEDCRKLSVYCPKDVQNFPIIFRNFRLLPKVSEDISTLYSFGV